MILVLGGSGYVGSAIRRCLTQRGIVHASVSRQECDYYQPSALGVLIDQHQPEFLINAAGFTGKPNVDACEDNKAECLLANAVLPGIIRDVCDNKSIPWGHVSSGCIYDGTRADGSGYSESDQPNFCFRSNRCSFYSGTKALGEEVLEGAPDCFIWRLRMPFDEFDSPRNYVSKILRYDKLLDVRNSLSHLGESAAACVDCWTQRAPFGTYNLTNTGSITTRDIVGLIRKSGLCAASQDFEFFSSIDEFMEEAAKAPRSNCVLDNHKALDAGLQFRSVDNAVLEALANWNQQAGANG